MNRVSAILVDDEINNLDNLSHLINKYCSGINIVSAIDSPVEAVSVIKQLKPDLLFLDIQMPQMNGFELLRQFDNPCFEVIFVTAFDQYALQAIKVCALDYLLKPIMIDELQSAVAKAGYKIETNHQNNQLLQLMQNINQVKPVKLGIPNRDRVDFIPVREIIYCQGAVNYTHIISKNSFKRTVCKTLKEYELMLASHNFIRVHQSFLINLEQVATYVKSDGGYLVMTDGMRISLSRHRKENVMEKLKQFGLIR